MSESNEQTEHPEHAAEHNLLSISTLLEREREPGLRTVLLHYRQAELSLQLAIDQLREIGRPRWALACSSRSHELRIQANRYIRAERSRKTEPAP